MSSILVTGALGYIGSHTCIKLLQNGYDVLAIDSLDNSSIDVLSSIKEIVNKDNFNNNIRLVFEKGDLRNQKWLNNIFRRFSNDFSPISAVIHFAGRKSVEESIQKPLGYWDVNLNSTLSLLTVMEQNDCANLVFSSSATIYEPRNFPVNENSVLSPVTPYGKTKLAIENILEDIKRRNELDWKIANLRYFNPVGCHETGLIGESSRGKASNLFPVLMNVISGKLSKLNIYGNDWPTHDGTCVRDYIHVMDVANAHIAALEYLNINKPQIINLNVGTGKGTSVLELIESFNRVNNCSVPFLFTERRNGDLPFVVADINKALATLNWKPLKSIDDICKDTWNYVQKSKKIF